MTTAPTADPNLAWATAAIEGELKTLAELPDEKIQKPGSVFSICLFKIAAIVKGDGRQIGSDQALNKIIAVCRKYEWMQEKEIRRQWARAYNKADPRRKPAQAIPAPQNSPRPTANGSSPTSPKASTNGATKEAAGLDIDVKNPKTKDYLTAFKMLAYEFRMNELDDSIECSKQPITDGLDAIICNRMRDIGLSNTSWVERAYREAAHENKYHPVKEFFDGLVWDDKDWIGWFCDHFWTETTGLGQKALQRWMIGAVAKVYQPYKTQNFMLVVDGPQGIGKSTWANWMCPNALDDFFIEGSINPEDKDSLLRLCTKFVWEVGELQATTRKADREALKNFISQKKVTIRKAYGRYDIVKPSLASMIGTINEDGAGFLADPTGSRRFVIINVDSFRWDYLKENPTNMWAQAVALYRAGYEWRLNKEEYQLQMQINAGYEVNSVVGMKFFEHFAYVATSDDHVTMDDIITTLETHGLKGSQQAIMNEISRILKKLGVSKMRIRDGERRPIVYKGVIRV